MKLKIFIILFISVVLFFLFIPFEKIVYVDNSNQMKCTIEIDSNTTLQLGYLFNDRMAITSQIESWTNVLLTHIVLEREDILQPIIIKKCTVTLFDTKGRIIPFKRIDWYNGGAIADKSMVHFKSESDLLEVNSKMYGEDIYYIFDELDNDELRIEYNFVFEIKGKSYEIKENKNLYRKVKWIFISWYDI